MDNRTTIKMNKETKVEFDKLHKKLQLKNHDATLGRIMEGYTAYCIICYLDAIGDKEESASFMRCQNKKGIKGVDDE